MPPDFARPARLALLLIALAGGWAFEATAQSAAATAATGSSGLWRDLDETQMVAALSAAPRTTARREIVPQSYRTLQLDHAGMQALLKRAPREFTLPMDVAHIEIEIPLPYGGVGRFRVQESPIMESGLAAKYPTLRTYIAQGVDDPGATARLDLTPRGFRAIVLSSRGQFFIDPYWSDDDAVYISYFKRNFASGEKPFHCDAKGRRFNPKEVSQRAPSAPQATGASLRTYRLALAATAEYTAAVSGANPGTVPQALAAMITTVNRSTAIYERDLAIRFVLVNNTDQLIFTDATTDGYTNSDGGSMLGQNQLKIDAVIGDANYDFGHVFSTGGGGIAGLGVICLSGQKANGVTGLPNPTGDPYDIDFVVHEMGHQFGANHPFNATSGNCAGGNREPTTAYEVGSGTTIMAYAGICSPQDLAPHSDDYFHGISYDEIQAYVASVNCAQITSTGNTAPVLGGLPTYTIPSQTPFALTASATDAQNDTLTYCWEEFDLGPAQDPTAAPRDNGSSPIFRSFDPSPSPTRIFPSLNYILSNAANAPAGSNQPPPLVGGYATGEFLPTTSRTMNFRVTVRDNRLNGGGVSFGTTTITSIAAAGPFAVTSQNAGGTIAAGSPLLVTWNVASTGTGTAVNCANVKISLSTDGGFTFPYVLAASVPNNGTASVPIPAAANVATTQGRVKVEAVGNIFFDISDANLTITSSNTAPTLSLNAAGINVARGTPTPTFAVVGTATDAESNPLTVSVSNLPGDVTVTPSISAGNIGLSVLADCSIVTTLTSRSYPITVTVTDSNGSTSSGTVNLNITPNPSPTLGTYPGARIRNTGETLTFTPSAAPADENLNLLPAPVSVQPTTLPGGGSISVNQTSGAFTVSTTTGTALGTYPIRVTVLDRCGAAAVRIVNLRVVPPTPILQAQVASGPSSESCAPANGAVDPGETVTVNLPVTNVGGGSTSNLTATLQSAGGVIPSGTQVAAVGALAPDAVASPPFTFTATGACGSTITASLQLQDGATNYGTVTYQIRLGAPQSVLTAGENFDAVTAPALPPGWTSTIVSGSYVNWATSTTTPDTAPNMIFATPRGTEGEVRLDSPAFTIPSSLSQVRFRHRYNTEGGYDGGVLEISIAGGAYTDIITAGGSFVSGAYDGPIDQNILPGRNAWNGPSNGNGTYVTTLINVPPAAGAQSVRFRFRLASDVSVTPSASFWRIDTLQIIDNFITCTSGCGQPAAFTSTAPPTALTVGNAYSFTFTATGTPAPTFSVQSGSLPPGLTLTSAGVLSGTPTSAGPGSFPNVVIATQNGIGVPATQTVSFTVATLAANYLAGFGLTGPAARALSDPDHDGTSNLLEYALGLDPTKVDVSALPKAQIRNYGGVPYVSVIFPRSSVATDINYLVEASGDLQAWTTVATSIGGGVTTGAGFVQETGAAPTFQVEVRDTQPVDPVTGSHRFLRLRATIP